MCQLLHFSSGTALHECFLHHLYEHRVTALALRDEERNVAAPAVRALTFLCSQLLVHLGLHELGALLFQHTQHRIRLRHALQQQFCQIDGILFVSH